MLYQTPFLIMLTWYCYCYQTLAKNSKNSGSFFVLVNIKVKLYYQFLYFLARNKPSHSYVYSSPLCSVYTWLIIYVCLKQIFKIQLATKETVYKIKNVKLLYYLLLFLLPVIVTKIFSLHKCLKTLHST